MQHNQRKKHSMLHPPLARWQIKAIAEKLNTGELSLPDLDLPTDGGYAAVWALVDSGSSVHAVNVSQVFLGALLEAPASDAKPFTCAAGAAIPHKGTAVVPFKTDDGLKSAVSWKHAGLEMPIRAPTNWHRINASFSMRNMVAILSTPTVSPTHILSRHIAFTW